MELNNTPINFKHITNSTAIAVKIKPVPRCLAEPGPEANWIFSMVFVIPLERPSESAPGEERRRAAARLTADVPECQTRSLGREGDAGWLPAPREKGKCPQSLSESEGRRVGVRIRWIYT